VIDTLSARLAELLAEGIPDRPYADVAREWATILHRETVRPALDAVYEERSRVLEWLTVDPDSHAVLCDNDPRWPGFVVLYVTNNLVGQMSWHIPAEQAATVFGHVPTVDPGHPAALWDGHSTRTKYARLRKLCTWRLDAGQRSGADHVRTAEMHAACAANLYAEAEVVLPAGAQRSDRERRAAARRGDRHLQLAAHHQQIATTLVMALGVTFGLGGDDPGDGAGWQHELAQWHDLLDQGAPALNQGAPSPE
jgi:hypothetical protein